MKRRRTGMWLVAVGLAAGLALSLLAQAEAQYPPPAGSVVLTAEDDTAVLGATVNLTATVQDQNGIPAAGVSCTFSIASQPGTDAQVDPGPVTTSSAGVAATTLNVGSTAGTIVVEALCGELSAQVSVSAGAAPPAAKVTTGLPPTGSGGAQDGPNGMARWALVSSGLAVAALVTALAWRRRQARSR